MGQYRPEFQVGSVAGDGRKLYAEIGRKPCASEIDEAYDAARDAGLWRFDERRPVLRRFAG
jgi:uncharacterized Fe-S radical SAM superfamily protein PflX